MSDSIIKWLFERKALFALAAVICLTILRYHDSLSDNTFGLCFGGLIGLLTADAITGNKTGGTP